MKFAYTILSSVTCTALQYCPALYHTRHDFVKKILNPKYFKFLYKIF